jgi:hypothetical protein
MPPVGFEPKISAGERPQTYALDVNLSTDLEKYLYRNDNQAPESGNKLDIHIHVK